MAAHMGRADRVAARILLTAAALAGLLAIWTALRRPALLQDPVVLREYLTFYAGPLVAGGLLMLWLARTRLITPSLSLVALTSVVFALYMAEIYIAWSLVDENGKIAEAAKTNGIEPDFRTEWEVTQDLRHSGVNAHPFFRPLSEPTLMPLGNSPQRTIVYCNEIGRRMTFVADRHGFNNPDPVWQGAGNAVVLLGDSYAHGACSPDNTGFAALLRQRGADLLNLGIGGNNPQLNLASLVEYGVPRRPRLVVWLHYAGNDLSGMMQMRDNAVLGRYVGDAGFNQNLIGRQADVEAFMDRFFVTRITPEFSTRPRYSFWRELTSRRGLIKAVKLETLRAVFGLTRNVADEVDFDLFGRIMARAQAVTQVSGARLMVLLVPAAGQLGAHSDAYERETERQLKLAGIEFINLRPRMLQAEDPHGLFAWRNRGGHLSPRGNVWLADLIQDEILSKEK